MANRERTNEVEARELVEQHTGISFRHADLNGGVDYLSVAPGLAALEVTTITDAAAKRTGAAAAPLFTSPPPVRHLSQCWLVAIDDHHPRLNGLMDRVEPLLASLESAGWIEFWEDRTHRLILEGHPLAPTFRALIAAGIRHAVALDPVRDTRPAGHTHVLHLSLVGGGASGGSDQSLGLIEAAMDDRADNARKLATADAVTKHLFVWLDVHTEFAISRPLDRLAESEEMPHFLLPSHPPQLRDYVDHLWIVHHGSRRGWHWNSRQWSAIEP